jgi:transcriptional regulator with XRE-family HTH domain
MVPQNRRRNTLGDRRSAALPALWAILRERSWSLADLARETEIDPATIARIAYGDRKPGRSFALKLLAIGVDQALWDEPCAADYAPHAPESGPTLPQSNEEATKAG